MNTAESHGEAVISYENGTHRDADEKKKFSTGGNVWDSVSENPNSANCGGGGGGGGVAPEAAPVRTYTPDAPADAEGADPDQDAVNVVVRVRPLNRQEVERKDNLAVQFPGNGVLWCESNSSLKPFAFNVLFEPEATQQDVFEHSGVKKLVSMATEGFSCTCFAFGQTGSGKTHTITGPPQQSNKNLLEDDYGMIQRSFVYLCELVDAQKKAGVTCTITASYFELYNEQVIDLLNARSGRKLNVRWSKDKGFHVENVFTVQCDSLSDLMAVLEEGLQNRSTTAHNMNELSSRSHSMLMLSVETEMPDPDDENLFLTKQGKLTFVDLAGSEKVKDTSTTGSQLLETNNINRSLLVLGKCISALGNPKKRLGHIPYRDSKLTKLLADSIGGNGVTLMVACVSPSSYNVGETMNTLRYATRAKRIRNQPVVRMDPREKLIMGMKKEIHLLRMENEYLREQLQFPRDSPRAANKISPSPAALSGAGSLGLAKASSHGEKISQLYQSKSTPSLTEKFYAADGTKRRQSNDATAARSEIAASVSAAVAAAVTDSALPGDDNQKDLYDMLKEYMVENESLRIENADMHQQGSRLQHDQQVLFRENDRLRRKIEDIERFLLSGGENRPFLYGSGAYPVAAWPWYEPVYANHSGLSSASSQASRYTYASSTGSETYGPGTPYTVPNSPVSSQFAGPRMGPHNHGQRHRQGQQRAYRLVHLSPPQPQPAPQLQQTPDAGPQASKPPLPSVNQGSYANGHAKPANQQKQKYARAKERTPPLRVVYDGNEEGQRRHEATHGEANDSGHSSSRNAHPQYIPNRSDSSPFDVGDRHPTTYAATSEVNERLKKELLELDGEIRSTQKAIQNSG